MFVKPRLPTSLGLGALAAVLYGSGLFIFFTPMPFFYLALHNRWLEVAKSTLTSLIIISAAYAISTKYEFSLPGFWLMQGQNLHMWSACVFGIFYFGFFWLIGVILGIGGHRQAPLFRLSVIAIISPILFWVLGIVLAKVGGWDLLTLIKNSVESLVGAAATISERAGESIQSEFIRRYSAQMTVGLFKMLPSLIFLFSALVVALNLIFGRRFFKTGHILKYLHNVARFQLPDPFIWMVIIAGVVFFLDLYVFKVLWPRFVVGNLAVAALGLYFWQGVAVLAYFLQQLKSPIIRIGIYILGIMFLQTIGLFLVVLGLADVWIGFRSRTWSWRHVRR